MDVVPGWQGWQLEPRIRETPKRSPQDELDEGNCTIVAQEVIGRAYIGHCVLEARLNVWTRKRY